jgi:hypothetical protein
MSKFYYLLKGTLYPSQDNLEDVIKINEIFKSDNPIEARERAIELYEKHVDLLLKNKGKKKKIFRLNELSIFLITKDSKTVTTTEGEFAYKDKLLINNLNRDWDIDRKYTYLCLKNEYELYQEYGYDCKNYVGKRETEEDIYPILKLPMDFKSEGIMEFL